MHPHVEMREQTPPPPAGFVPEKQEAGTFDVIAEEETMAAARTRMMSARPDYPLIGTRMAASTLLCIGLFVAAGNIRRPTGYTEGTTIGGAPLG